MTRPMRHGAARSGPASAAGDAVHGDSAAAEPCRETEDPSAKHHGRPHRAVSGTASGSRPEPPPKPSPKPSEKPSGGNPADRRTPDQRSPEQRSGSRPGIKYPVRFLPSSHRTATLLAALTWLLGVLTIISAVLPAQRARLRALHQIVPTPASATATAVAATLGVLLLYLSGGLRRRKRRAWRLAVAATMLIAASHVLKGLDLE